MAMNIYGDESGSINNKQTSHNPHFVVGFVRVLDTDKLRRVYKRFVSANMEELKRLDIGKNKMFKDGRFVELKGSCFDKPMKEKFCDFFSRNPLFELYFIITDNSHLSDQFCTNTARAYNYLVCKSLEAVRRRDILPDEACLLQLDERNERTETKYFLENYLNTELVLTSIYSNDFLVKYFDSAQNKLIQVADVFSNIMYSHLITKGYTAQFDQLRSNGLIKFVFNFPLPS